MKEDDHDRFIELADDNDLELATGSKHIDSSFSVDSFFENQKKIIDTLSDKQVEDLCGLVRMITGGMKTMDCEHMIMSRAVGFWLIMDGSPVIYCPR